jgi:hypothetical protein
MNKDILIQILTQLGRVETKLDNVIKAMHDYDGNDEYGESSFEAFMDTQAKSNLVGPCRGHDAASWDEEEAELNKRMDIIGQNGNEGTHYVTNEEADEDAFNDYGMRVMGDNNTQNKHNTGEDKKRNPKQAPREGYTEATPFVKTKDRRRYYKPKNK